MLPEWADRPVGSLTAATVGVYVLVMAGATAAVVDAVAACATWPTCGALSGITADPQLTVAVGHRVLAGVVGLLLVWAAASIWRDGGRLVRLGVGIPLLLYPVQVAVGALLALTAPTRAVAGVHLAVGVVIFVSLTLALGALLRERYDGSVEPAPTSREATNGNTPTAAKSSGSPTPSGLRATVSAYLRLTKPRLMWLLCLVAAAGMALAAGPALTWRTAAVTLLGGVFAIGASGTFNHVLERDVDRRMRRTADRPLATDQVGVGRALAFGVLLAVAAVGLFATLNALAAALGLAAIAYYSVVYTLLLKPNTVQNTVVGGLAGAFPALIGAAAATNAIGLPALLLAALIFLWTPAHFYNLALLYREDYERGGFPMLPVVRGEAATRSHILGYLAATLIAAAGLAAVARLGPIYAVSVVIFGGVFLVAVVALHRRPSRRTAWRSFHASNAFLGAILLATVVDALVL